MLSIFLTNSHDRHHQVALDRKVQERFDRSGSWLRSRRNGLTGELRLAVDHHPAAAADRHSAGPAEGQRPIDMILDVLQRLQNRHVIDARNFVGLHDRRCVCSGR